MGLIKRSIKKLIQKAFYQIIRNTELARLHAQIASNMSRGTASMQLRKYNALVPVSWEFTGFSQNGEDGIINELIEKLPHLDKYFVEIGSANGIENNTAWLAHVRKFKGLMIDGDAGECELNKMAKPWLVDVLNLKVYPEDTSVFFNNLLTPEPDFFSLDIDSFDYYVAKAIFNGSFKPKIVAVEYNSVFGPERAITIDYNQPAHKMHYLYYGVSVAAWKRFFSKQGYSFITVDSNGVNAFFVRNDLVDRDWVNSLQKLDFMENAHQVRKYKCGWEEQFSLIKDCTFVEVE